MQKLQLLYCVKTRNGDAVADLAWMNEEVATVASYASAV
jgi:hypothetical protein